jgi:hypothetical protein
MSSEAIVPQSVESPPPTPPPAPPPEDFRFQNDCDCGTFHSYDEADDHDSDCDYAAETTQQAAPKEASPSEAILPQSPPPTREDFRFQNDCDCGTFHSYDEADDHDSDSDYAAGETIEQAAAKAP